MKERITCKSDKRKKIFKEIQFNGNFAIQVNLKPTRILNADLNNNKLKNK